MDEPNDDPGKGGGEDFSWYKEMQRKQKQIDILLKRGKEKTQEIKKLREQLAELEKGKAPDDPEEGKGKGDDPEDPEKKKKKPGRVPYPWEAAYWRE